MKAWQLPPLFYRLHLFQTDNERGNARHEPRHRYTDNGCVHPDVLVLAALYRVKYANDDEHSGQYGNCRAADC
ncbi:MAG: hypothetical protein LBS18_07510 [Clostridiales bacterium]|nr:hypothetical protein [Clostridiales bacterium]